MSEPERPNLPEQSCANCGFLFGLVRQPASREDAIFDPDLIRSVEYPPPHDNGTFPRSVITSQPHNRATLSDYDEPVDYLTWADTALICCYWKKFPPIRIEAMRSSSFDYGKNKRKYVPLSSDHVLATIREDRTNCEGFFPYYSGFTPVQHTELRLNELQAKQLQKHELRLAEWSAEQEKRLHRITLEAEKQWRASENRLTVRLGIIGVVIAIVQIIISIALNKP